jgi:histidinol-phosphate aminotransferase
MNEKMDIRSMVRPNIASLVPYSSARDEFSGSAMVFLDANENPYNVPLNRYPDPGQKALKQAVAEVKRQQAENLFLGNGSDEGIDLLIRILCTPGVDNVVTVEPTYGMYAVSARIHDVAVKQVLLRPDFSLDAKRVLEAVDERTKIIFLCSPNNPTSNSLDPAALERVIDGAGCMVVLDEAYIDFSSQEGCLSMVPRKKNLVVLQTFSKAWGLAGIRLGMVFAHPELIGYLSHVKYPYNINSLTIGTALGQLAETGKKERWVEQILQERERLSGHLGRFGFVERVYPSDANFLLVKVQDPHDLYHYLAQRGIVVRDRSNVPLCEGALRITAGTKQENSSLLQALESYDATKKSMP